jgi:hypothetical protein
LNTPLHHLSSLDSHNKLWANPIRPQFIVAKQRSATPCRSTNQNSQQTASMPMNFLTRLFGRTNPAKQSAPGALPPTTSARPKTSPTERLLIAATSGNLEWVDDLLREGAQINGTDEEGNTPLMLATKNRHVVVVALLLEEGADPNVTRAHDGAHAANLALSHFKDTHAPEYIEILKLLISKGLNEVIRMRVARLADLLGLPEIYRLFHEY